MNLKSAQKNSSLQKENIDKSLLKVLHKKNILFPIFLKTFIMINLAVNSGLFSWELSKEREGIKVYTRNSEGFSIKEFKAVGFYRGSISSIVSALQDESTFCKWFPDCKEFKILKRYPEQDRLQYIVIKAPFPVSNRDSIQRTKLTQETSSKIVTIQIDAQPDEIPKVDGVVRVPRSKGYWKFIPIEKGKVEVIFQLQSDPGGSLPDWIANLFVTENPLKSLINLFKLAETEKFKNTTLDYIIEP